MSDERIDCEVVQFYNAPRLGDARQLGKKGHLLNAVSDVGTGARIALVVKRGRTWIHIILMDSAGIRVRKLRVSEERYMTALDYPVARAKKQFRAAHKRFGGSREARKFLKG